MGRTTPNIGIYIPAPGETNYAVSFAAGMDRIDQHDHSGAPDGGVPIPTAGLADGSVTRAKLNPDVVLAGGGLATSGGFPNALITDGVLNSIYNLGGTGIIAKLAGNTAATRTITGQANTVTVTNGDGVAGNPTITLPVAATTAWVPTIVGQSSAGVGTYATQQGFYIRLGALVIATCEIRWTAHTGTGDMQVGGFPFNFVNTTDVIANPSFGDFVLPASTIDISVSGNNGTTLAAVVASRDNDNRTDVQMDTTGRLYFTMVYFCA